MPIESPHNTWKPNICVCVREREVVSASPISPHCSPALWSLLSADEEERLQKCVCESVCLCARGKLQC